MFFLVLFCSVWFGVGLFGGGVQWWMFGRTVAEFRRLVADGRFRKRVECVYPHQRKHFVFFPRFHVFFIR